VAEDRLDRQPAANALLTFADPRKQHLRVRAPGKLDQLRPQVLLQRTSAERSPGGKLVASLIGYIPNGDSSRHGIIMQLAAAKPPARDQGGRSGERTSRRFSGCSVRNPAATTLDVYADLFETEPADS